MLIIGQKGNGKSSLGNTLLRREVFGVDSGMVATTKECMWESGSIDGINLSVSFCFLLLFFFYLFNEFHFLRV